MSKVNSKPLRLSLSPKASSAIQAAAAQVIAEMNRAGISGDGTPFPPGKTREITMSESGRLHRDFTAYTTRVNWSAPYAKRWQELYNWAGIPAEGPWQAKFATRVQEIINERGALISE